MMSTEGSPIRGRMSHSRYSLARIDWIVAKERCVGQRARMKLL